MEQLKQSSNRCVILLHEIYGVNAHMKYYANFLYQKGFDVYVPNLLQKDTVFSYEEEELAYQNFMGDIGFKKAKNDVDILINDLSKEYNQIHIVGFSIGATIAWLCSNNNYVYKVIGFYGSRIRQYTDIVPNAEIVLLFGKQEKSFNPIELKTNLNAYSNVRISIVDGEHGFADPYSSKYNEQTTNNLLECLFD
ncbi:dienelactone hydrolase family protein [Psychrobacillus sp. MER TA 171]|uniref:dienelactone hydrolase family protein n=1 Tax=Psychrobacillus sp. MER TA 171 TaxID=2939577 RepID=UPI00203C92C6|nr:dienelactone hydrolase family protein [Psychrobacillus sp. MER TA 171]MCM3359677.1 dienelactone hydrolase family protein [Psychrobacillus sp. MER TA 171]